jgi:uncharacterized protein (DUF983 family)
MADVGAALRAGVLGRCPDCGKGRLYRSYLRIAARCDVCGGDFSMADVGDGAAVFVILIVGAIAAPFVLVAQMGFGWPPWAVALAAVVLVTALSLALLPVAKAVLFTLQRAHGAREGRLED